MISFKSLKLSQAGLFCALVASTAIVSSCSRDATPRASLDGDATFIVESPVDLVQAKQSVDSADWSIPTRNSMTFKACLKDVAKLQPIVLQTFAIRGDNGSQNVTTDNQGCLTWNEEIPFDYTQPETYLQGTHAIEGLGPHKGSREIPLAINPWQTGGSDALLDLRQNPSTEKLVRSSSITEGLRLARQAIKGDQKAKIHIDSIGIGVNDDRFDANNDAVFSREISFTPELSRIGIDGSRTSTPISNGRFEIQLTLLERNPDKSNDQLLILSKQTIEGTAENGKLKLDTQMKLDRLPGPRSTFELAFKVAPVRAPFDLLPEEGFVRMTSLTASASPQLMPFTSGINSYLEKAHLDTIAFQVRAQSQALSQSGATCKDGSDQLGFYIQNIAVENKGVTSRSENEHFPSQVLGSYQVCLANSLSKAPIGDQSFEVQLIDAAGNASPVQTVSSQNGCLSFTDPIDFDYFRAENWAEKTLKITSHDAPYQEMSRTFPISIDPWAKDSNFFWDCRRGERPAFKTAAAQIDMTDFSSNFMGRDLEFDSRLDLTLKRRYLFKIAPRLKRVTGFDGLVQYEPLVDGRYHLRVLLLSPNQDEALPKISEMSTEAVLKNFKYISSYEQDIATRDGQIIENVTLPIQFADVPLLNSRAAVIVELSSLDSGSQLVSKPFYSPFMTMDDSGALTLVSNEAGSQSNTSNEKMGESNVDVAKLIALGKQSRQRLQAKGSSIESFAKTFNLERASEAQLEAAGFNASSLRSLFASSKISIDNAKKICKLLSISCGTKPQNAIESIRSNHVESITNTPTVLDSNYSTLSMSASLTMSQSADQSASDGQSDNKSSDWHASVGASTGGGVNFLGFFHAGAEASGGKGWSMGKSWYKSQVQSQSRGSSGSGSVSRSRSFAVEELTFGFRAGTRQCLTVRPKKASSSGSMGTMICEADAKNIKDMTESFYLLTENSAGSSSPLRDVRTNKESPWIKAIRGKKAFAEVQSILTDQRKTLVLRPDSVQTQSLERLDEMIDQFAKTHPSFSDGSFPSVIY